MEKDKGISGNESKLATRSTLINHNIMIDNRRTSVRLEKEMWMAFKEIAINEDCTIHDLCDVINRSRKKNTSLTAAIRIFIMVYFQSASTPEGHKNAGHGCGPKIAEGLIKRHDNTPYYGLRIYKNVHKN